MSALGRNFNTSVIKRIINTFFYDIRASSISEKLEKRSFDEWDEKSKDYQDRKCRKEKLDVTNFGKGINPLAGQVVVLRLKCKDLHDLISLNVIN